MTDKQYIIGLTGQTGAGKSTVAKILEKNGLFIINADSVAREVVQKGEPTLSELARSFGGDIINEDGTLNRKLLANRAFSSRENTDLLNSITHPAITERIRLKISQAFENGEKAVVIDAPQLFESGENELCDFVVTVTAPLEVRLNRIMNRDGVTEDEARFRINAQLSEEYYIKNSDIVIRNYPPHELNDETEKILTRLSQGA